jgi:hypothetical protein
MIVDWRDLANDEMLDNKRVTSSLPVALESGSC